eukprot:12820412-Alexandrium_andersonii.AAC.1
MHVQALGVTLELRKTQHGHLCMFLDGWPDPAHISPATLPDDGAEIALCGARVAEPSQPRLVGEPPSAY